MKLLYFGLILLSLSACSMMSRTECEQSDWHELGVVDGSKGAVSSRFSDYMKACAKHGIQPQAKKYFQGREAGLKTFCTPSNAYDAGTNGHIYGGVCPAAVEAKFLDRYQEGRTIYILRRELEDAQARISYLESQVSKLQDASKPKN